MEQRVPRARCSRSREITRRPHGAPALPGGPLQGAARAAHRVPRHQPRRLLRRPGLLARAARPDAGRPGPAAGLPVDRDAGPGRGGVLDHLDVHPGDDQGEGGREILRGLLAVDADAGNKAGKPAADYGLLRLLEYGSATPSGPGQVLNQIKNSPERSQNEAAQLSLAQYITQNSSGGKTLTYGNLLSFPLEGRMLYVQPIYVQAASGSGSFPQNKAVVAVYGNKVAWADTLERPSTACSARAARADDPTEPDGPPTTPARHRGGSARPRRSPRSRRPTRPARMPSRPATSPPTASAEAARRRDPARSGPAPQLAVAGPTPSPSPSGAASPSPSPLDHGVTDRLTPPHGVGRSGLDLSCAGCSRTLEPYRARVLRSRDSLDAGWSSSVARRAHNPEVAGSNPAPATNDRSRTAKPSGFCHR